MRARAFVLLTASLGAAPAQAQSPATLPDTAPATAPPKPARFFSTYQLGGGYFYAGAGTAPDDRTFRGGTVSGQLALGGRVSRRVSLGGGLTINRIIGLSAEDALTDGDEPNLDEIAFTLWGLGFLMDVAASPEPGFHFEAMLAAGALTVTRSGGDADDPSGLLLSLGVGYDHRVGEHLAVGGMLRAIYAPFSVDEVNGADVAILQPALLLTLTTR